MGSTKIQAPEPIDYGEQMAGTLRAQRESMQGTGEFSDLGRLVDIEAEQRPAWTNLELQTMRDTMQGRDGNMGLLGLYRDVITPALSETEAAAMAARTKSEQALIDKYGPSITNKLRDAAGNRELIEGIVADASGETDPALLSAMVSEAMTATGGYTPITAGADISPSQVSPAGIAVAPEAGYIAGDRQMVGGMVDGGLYGAGQEYLGSEESTLQQGLRQRAEDLLAAGGGLTEQDRRRMQDIKATQAARGLAVGPSASLMEQYIMAREGDERSSRQLAQAAGLSGQLEQERLGRTGLGAGLMGQAYGQGMGLYQTDVGRSAAQQQMGLAGQEASARMGLEAQLANQRAGMTAEEANRAYDAQRQLGDFANRQQAMQADRAFRANVLQQQQGVLGSQYGRRMGAAQLAQGTSADPFLSLLGRPSQSFGMAQGFGGQGMAMGQSLGPKIFSPESQMSMDITQGNRQRQLAVAQANQASSNAMKTGMMGMVGGIAQGAGAAIGCHVAREVYGEENPKWVRFFVWKETQGPRWFKALYNEYSEQWAAFIRNKPRIKNLIRNWMDRKIRKA